MNKILHLNLYRKYFDEIANGTKTIEYRDRTDYWKKRIEHREYDIIKFRNGYAKDAPTMNPRDSIPTITSGFICTHSLVNSSITSLQVFGLVNSGLISRNIIPGLGKS